MCGDQIRVQGGVRSQDALRGVESQEVTNEGRCALETPKATLREPFILNKGSSSLNVSPGTEMEI